MGKLERVTDSEVVIYPANDCFGKPCQTSNRSWFYFSVTGGEKDNFLKICIRNMNPQPKLYGNDYRPFVKRVPGNSNWERCADLFLPFR